MPTNGVITERSLFMPALTLWLRDWIVERLEHAPHVADGTRRSARAVGDVVERLYRHVAAIAVFPERGKQRREFLLALPRALAVAIVQLHVGDHPLRQPAVHQRGKRLLLHAARGAAVEHAPDGRTVDLLHDVRGLLKGVDERGLLGRERLDAIDHAGLFGPPGHRGEALLRARQRSEEHTSELQSLAYLVCRLLLEKKKHK